MMKYLGLSVILSILLLISSAPKCEFPSYRQQPILTPLSTIESGNRFLEETEWQPIRIHFDFSNLEEKLGGVDSENADRIKGIKNTIGIVSNALSSILKVKRFVNPIKISSSDFINCDDRINISSEFSVTGVNADLIIFVSFDTDSSDNTLAYAGPCNLNSDNRPVTGYIYFTNKSSDYSKKNAAYNNSILILHEINHILAFNDGLFGLFVEKSKEDVVKTKTVNGKETKIMILPKVIEAAKKHFNCPTLDGVELEDQGSSGSAGSHWEQRIMDGEFMTAEFNPEGSISEMSLALFEETGWYQVNYYSGGLFRFGKNKGCEFLNSKCIENGKSISENEFTYVENGGQIMNCNSSRTSKGAVVISIYENIPEIYQYYSNPTWGGSMFADYCSLSYPFESAGWNNSGNCVMGLSEYEVGLGETIGQNSSCFYSSLVYKGDDSISQYRDTIRPICHQFLCDYKNKKYSVSIRGKNFECSKEESKTVDGFDGIFNCVDFDLICTKTVNCTDVLDCISKKSLRFDGNIDNPSDNNTENDPNNSENLIYSIYSLIAFLIIFV